MKQKEHYFYGRNDGVETVSDYYTALADLAQACDVGVREVFFISELILCTLEKAKVEEA